MTLRINVGPPPNNTEHPFNPKDRDNRTPCTLEMSSSREIRVRIGRFLAVMRQRFRKRKLARRLGRCVESPRSLAAFLAGQRPGLPPFLIVPIPRPDVRQRDPSPT